MSILNPKSDHATFKKSASTSHFTQSKRQSLNNSFPVPTKCAAFVPL